MDKLKEYGFTIFMVVLLVAIAAGFYLYVLSPWKEISAQQADLKTKSQSLTSLAGSGGVFNENRITELKKYKSNLRRSVAGLIGRMREFNEPLFQEPDSQYTQMGQVFRNGEIDVLRLRDAYKSSLDRWQGSLSTPGYFKHPESGKKPEGLSAEETGGDYQTLTSGSPSPEVLSTVLRNLNIRHKIFEDLFAVNINQLEVISVGKEETGERRPRNVRNQEIEPFEKVNFRLIVQCPAGQTTALVARLLGQHESRADDEPSLLVRISELEIKKVVNLNTEDTSFLKSDQVEANIKSLLDRASERIAAQKPPMVRLTVKGVVLHFNEKYLFPDWRQQNEMEFIDPWSGFSVDAEVKAKIEALDRQGAASE